MIKFNYVKWKNLLSTGNVWTQIDLNRSANTLIVGDNGSGKSTMLDALTFALFGKPYRKISKSQLINSINEKGVEVEISFNIGTNHYRVLRGIKPNIFEIHKNDQLMDQTGHVNDYQEILEKNILKLNYSSFTQVIILSAASFVPFMQLTGPQRREIVEDLLDIKIFSSMNTLLKALISTNKDNVTGLKHDIDLKENKKHLIEKHLTEIKVTNTNRDEQTRKEIAIAESSITDLNEAINKLNEKIKTLSESITDQSAVEVKFKKVKEIESKLEDRVKRIKKTVSFYENNDVCPSCSQDIGSELKKEKLDDKQSKLVELNEAISKLEKEFNDTNSRIEEIMKVNTDITNTNTDITHNNNQISSLNTYINKLRKLLDSDTEEKTDTKKYTDEIDELEEMLKQININYEKYMNEKEVLDLTANLLNDKGIKTQIVKQYVPIMNRLVNKYLSSMDFFVNFEFDENFIEKIKSRYRDDFSYSSFSEGEKMRIDLALLLTWRAIARMKNSADTNLLILDEVFDASLDVSGCDDFLKLIHDQSSDHNIFVISHKGDMLQDKFRSVITFEKTKNFSSIAK